MGEAPQGKSSSETRLRAGAQTSVGQVRENNEDNLHLWMRDTYLLAVVADGMGGAVAGEEASRIAVEAITETLIKPEDALSLADQNDEFIIEHLQAAVRDANSNIVAHAASHPELRGMGTTTTLAFVRNMHGIIAHVGDSRAYLVEPRNRRITQITADHSFVQALVAAGHITQDQAEEHPMGNVLYRALGQTEEVEVDVYEVMFHSGDRLVLCSDGLTRHLKARDVADIVLMHPDPEAGAQALVDLANGRGGEDNISVIVVVIEGDAPLSQLDDTTVELRSLLRSQWTNEAEGGETDDTLRLKRHLNFDDVLTDADDTVRRKEE